MSRIRWILILLALILLGPSQEPTYSQNSAPQQKESAAVGMLDRVTFDGTLPLAKRFLPLIHYTWLIGERAIPMTGVKVTVNDRPLTFTLTTHKESDNLTIALREFRTENNGGVAYLVTVNGRKVAFRNEKLNDAGPTTGFVDIPPDLARSGKLSVRLINLSPGTVQIAEATLYRNLDECVRREGMLQPLTLYLTGRPDPAQLRRWRALWLERPQVQLGWCDPQFSVAQWTPERQKSELDKIIAFGRENNIPLEVDPVSWWGGTPTGPDGVGGRWTDVTYQQVTYSRSLNRYGLSVPNRWSNVPWLTMGNERLNTFRADALQNFGVLVRSAYQSHREKFPIHSLVIDNEPTYWGAGNPGGSPFSEWDTPDAVADFNPAMVAAARHRGVTLDPSDGLDEAEAKFLRGTLTAYDHQMHAALHRGMGAIPLADRVYTHSFESQSSGIWKNIVQGTGTGVLRSSRLGVEGSIGVHGDFDQFREVGVPAANNVEMEGGSSAGPVVEAAYATGCDHVTLFNASDMAVSSARESLDSGWREFKPRPWRLALYSPNVAALLNSGAAVQCDGIRASGTKLLGSALGKDNRLLLHLRSQDATATTRFVPLALRYSGRAFVYQQKNPGSFLAVRVGATRDSIHEISRLSDSGGEERQIDISPVAAQSADLWIEFDFHPLGLTDWVNLFSFSLERPWPDENLIAPNRSYRADRLRAESSLTGWRADASWSLGLAAALPPTQLTAEDKREVKVATALFAAGLFARANAAARLILSRHVPDAVPPSAAWTMPPPDRDETGQLAQAGSGALTLDPYQPGFTGRSIPVSSGASITLVVNRLPPRSVAPSELLPGDDVQIEVRQGLAVSIRASRGTAQARIIALTQATPYHLPTVTLEGQPARSITTGLTGQDGKPWIYAVGDLPLSTGDLVYARWNPATERLVELRFAK